MKYHIFPVVFACSVLSGCGTLSQKLFQNAASESVSAAPLGTLDDLKDKLDLKDPGDKKEFLARVVVKSEESCNAFLNRIVIGENTINTAGDLLGTAFSALSTAFTPLGTKTALSAGASIATGSRTAIDADIYAKAATSDFAKAIQQTYYVNIQNYTDKLPTLPDTTTSPLILSNEVAKIQSYHAMCALAPAESSIQAKLAQPSVNVGNGPPADNSHNSSNGSSVKGANLQLEPEPKPVTTQAGIPGSVY